LAGSDMVIIPLQTEFLAMQGLAKLKQVVSKVQARINKDLKIGGVIATMFDHRKVLNRDVVETIEKYFGDLVFQTKIRDNIALAEAPSQGKDIFQYSPQSPGADDYLSLAEEIVERSKSGVPVEA
jgi:chromosome partitioning protein